MVAQDRTHGASAAPELRHAGRTMTGAAGALLLVHLLAGAVDVGAPQRLVRPGLALGELPAHHARNQVRAGLKPKYSVAELQRAGGRAVDRRHVELHGVTLPSPLRPMGRRRPLRSERGTCQAAGRPLATASSPRRAPRSSLQRAPAPRPPPE